MRCFLSIAATLMLSTPLMAEASKNTCTTALMSGPDHGLYRALRVSPAQAHELRSIRYQTDKRQARLQRKLQQVRQDRWQIQNSPHHGWRLRQLERKERRLTRRLNRESQHAPQRAFDVLAPWQQRRCSRMTAGPRVRPTYYAPPRVRPTYYAPPKHRRTYAPAPRRPAKRHYTPGVKHGPTVYRAAPAPARPRYRSTRKASVRLAVAPPVVRVGLRFGR